MKNIIRDHNICPVAPRTCGNCDNNTTCKSCRPGEVWCSGWSSKNQRPAATPEPMSKPGLDNVLPEVKKDLDARDRLGIMKYKTSLQTHDGRDALNDAYQEALDLVMYLKQAIMERDGHVVEV